MASGERESNGLVFGIIYGMLGGVVIGAVTDNIGLWIALVVPVRDVPPARVVAVHRRRDPVLLTRGKRQPTKCSGACDLGGSHSVPRERRGHVDHPPAPRRRCRHWEPGTYAIRVDERVSMGIRESSGFSRSGSAYDAQHAADSIAELEAQYAAGEIERHAYFEKKRSLCAHAEERDDEGGPDRDRERAPGIGDDDEQRDEAQHCSGEAEPGEGIQGTVASALRCRVLLADRVSDGVVGATVAHRVQRTRADLSSVLEAQATAEEEQMADRETRYRALAERYLPDALLARIRDRAADNDRRNRFFWEDLDDLRDHGYLTLFVPEQFGGPGLSLNQVSRLQQRLAAAAPATALAVNMHLMCIGSSPPRCSRGVIARWRTSSRRSWRARSSRSASASRRTTALYGSHTAAEPLSGAATRSPV
ncbi:Putative acyl-CoA dehydrogenase YdbM [Eumeta japonica]|uniref:Acyl-CoA dehydrogenase YdbM n=1 Tax=Eumeta variegata TaxID=151549 RepID=A0A4C1S7M0_EUMVA|nr:Putative acyl-CoA dehydrogenase YdbM [Eumeta japonica]